MKSVLAVVATGVMWFLSTGVNNWWPLAWLAPLPLLVLLPGLPLGRAAVAAFAASAIGALNLAIAYLRLPPPIWMGAIALIAVPFTLVALAWRLIARARRPVVAVIAYAALVAATEYLISVVSPHGTFGSLAYSQSDVPVVLQLASLTGLAGITFVLSLLPAVLAVAWRHRQERRVVVAALASALLPLGVMLAFGAARLAAPHSSQSVSIGLAASDDAVAHFDDTDPARALPVVRGYAARAAALADRGATIIVLPEKFVGVTPGYADEARAILADVARQRRVMIVAGFNLLGASEARNTAVVFDSNGRVILEYDKQYLVPGLEIGYRRGNLVGMVPGSRSDLGVAICKDLDFVPLGRAYAHAGAGLLLVPAWDFVTDGWAHSRMAVVRGVEAGFAIARTAVQGRLTVSDARGRIIAERKSSEAPDVLLTASVPIAPGGTLYTQTGDWFAWLCVAAAVACFFLARRRSWGGV
jgi:apolipoprotein N-acyltransferase